MVSRHDHKQKEREQVRIINGNSDRSNNDSEEVMWVVYAVDMGVRTNMDADASRCNKWAFIWIDGISDRGADMTVKQLMNKLKRMPEDAKVVIYNDEMFYSGMYYATDAEYDETMGEPQVEIKTDYERIAKGWENK